MRPTAVMILGQPFQIDYLADPRENPLGTSRADGSTNVGEQRIVIRDNTAHHQERDTVLHELLHAMSITVGQPLKERHVSALAPVLLDVLRSNPALVAYLVEPVA